jgi:2-oxoglutarate ferredoxin oxidoreductase subunit alpha
MWRESADPRIAAAYIDAYSKLVAAGYRVIEAPFERACRAVNPDTKRGKNMFVLGALCNLYSLSLPLARDQVAVTFGKKDAAVIEQNVALLDAGYAWAEKFFDFKFAIPGVLASGMEICAMYPITPATSASHYLSDVFEKVGGVVHQAEDEIAACAFAIGASYAGKCTVTITSGPGYSLKQEALGLAVMGEIPLVVVNVQRGGPSTGQPTKVEQGDLFAAIFGSHGDAPKVVLAPATIEECFYSIITARRIAESFNMVVVVLSDASLATSQQPFPRPRFDEAWLAPPIDQTAVPEGMKPYDWDAATGLARRFIPGQRGGMHTLTGLAHDRDSHVAYDPEINEETIHFRSLKLAALQRTLQPPLVYGDAEGDLLVIGWGSTKGAIEEAVATLREEGHKVSSLHLRFLNPLPGGIKEVMRRFKRVMTVEGNWCDRLEDELIDETNRRYSALAMLLRARYLVDVDCWSEVKGQPIKPGTIRRVLAAKLEKVETV